MVSNVARISSDIDLKDLNVSSDQYDMVLNKLCSLYPDIEAMKKMASELKNDKDFPDEEILEKTLSGFESMNPVIESLKVKGNFLPLLMFFVINVSIPNKIFHKGLYIGLMHKFPTIFI